MNRTPSAAPQPAPSGGLDFTGERMVPETADPATFWEHVYRYRFATKYVRNQRVLDIACGEGYGAAAFNQSGARSVIGIELALDVCKYARAKYSLTLSQANAEQIPLRNHSVDVVVSFETIEHLQAPETFLDECLRVLTPGGTLIISTPNRDVYREICAENPFHVHELSEIELGRLLQARFNRLKVYVQRPVTVKWWSWKSLIAMNTPWLRVRGFWRARSILSNLLCTHLSAGRGQPNGMRTSDLINANDWPLAWLCNPYLVRRHSRIDAEIACYIVIVAQL